MSPISFITEEVRAVYRFLVKNSGAMVIITATTLVIVLEHYYPVWNEWFANLLYFGVIPLGVIIIILRKNPLDFGLRLGNWKVWSFHVLVFCLIAWLLLYLVSGNPSLINYYRLDDFSFIRYFLTSAASLLGTEFLFRGFLLFGLREKFGETSIFIQTIPFVLVHLGKPDLETLSCIITGIYFGYICYRGKSFWPAFIVHMFINVFFVSVVNL
jgi:membrane protease YdiL (CAAX protease family)